MRIFKSLPLCRRNLMRGCMLYVSMGRRPLLLLIEILLLLRLLRLRWPERLLGCRLRWRRRGVRLRVPDGCLRLIRIESWRLGSNLRHH